METDCCLTADGDVVLLHDPLLSLGTTLRGWAHQRTCADICASRLLSRSGSPTDQRPLRLEELLDLAPAGVTLQLEVKAHADALLARLTVHAIHDRIAHHPLREQIEILSFWAEACQLAAALGLKARLVIIADYRIEALAAWGRSVGLHGVCVEHFLLTPAIVASLRLASLSVTTGTVNHADELAVIAALGLDAITSDAPHELSKALVALREPPLALA